MIYNYIHILSQLKKQPQTSKIIALKKTQNLLDYILGVKQEIQ